MTLDELTTHVNERCTDIKGRCGTLLEKKQSVKLSEDEMFEFELLVDEVHGLTQLLVNEIFAKAASH
jgi:hypothetical protein